jgi:predicted RecB family nuclease
MLLAFDAFVLSEMLGCENKFAKIIHGDERATLKVKVGGLASEIRKRIAKIRTLISSDSPPQLILNRHYTVCEFQQRCRQKALETDDLSLLANLPQHARKEYNSKGIFTVNQLSFTFRPRRRPKHLKEKREKYHHSLKALAIRERRIHIVGRPELNITGTQIFFDVESVPDRDFYYLIGMRIVKNDCCVQHSFWADTQQDERRIWREFLQVCADLKDPVLIHYGSYEAVFLRRMCERYPMVVANPALLEKMIKDSVNILACIYGQVYFPTYSNSLKEIAAFLGFSWPERETTGVHSIIWRHEWEKSMEAGIQQKLRAYNQADCEALELLVKALRGFPSPEESVRKPENGNPVFVTTCLSGTFSHPDWREFKGAMPELDRINEAAQWDYQRDRIYLRAKEPSRRRPRKHHIERSSIERIDKVILSPECPVCSKCLLPSRKRTKKVSYLLQELVFGRSCVKRRTVRQDFQQFWCKTCGDTFGRDERFHANTRFGWNFISLYFYLVIDLGIQQRRVARILERLFDVSISTGGGSHLKTRVAHY